MQKRIIPEKNGPGLVLYEFIIENTDLSMFSKFVYCKLSQSPVGTRPSVIARSLNMSEKQVEISMDELESERFIIVDKHQKEGIECRFLWHPSMSPELTLSDARKQAHIAA